MSLTYTQQAIAKPTLGCSQMGMQYLCYIKYIHIHICLNDRPYISYIKMKQVK